MEEFTRQLREIQERNGRPERASEKVHQMAVGQLAAVPRRDSGEGEEFQS